MYNRYIPQPDGSYRRNRMADTIQPQQIRQPDPPPIPPDPPQQHPQPPQQPPAEPPKSHQSQPAKQPPPARQNIGAGDFLRQLLPKDLDTGDLLVIALLLLMSADCQEDRNTALLTLVLYLFM